MRVNIFDGSWENRLAINYLRGDWSRSAFSGIGRWSFGTPMRAAIFDCRQYERNTAGFGEYSRRGTTWRRIKTKRLSHSPSFRLPKPFCFGIRRPKGNFFRLSIVFASSSCRRASRDAWAHARLVRAAGLGAAGFLFGFVSL